MPYSRKTYGRKKTYRRRSKKAWYNQKYSAAQIASKAWSLAKYVKSLVNVERKFNDTTIAAASVTNVGSRQWISSISEGTDYNQRTGISVKCCSIQMRATAEVSATVNDEAQYLRLCLIVDTEETAPGYTDVFETTDVRSPLNHVNGKRFKVLKDQLIPLSAAGPTSRVINWWIPYHGHLHWSNSTTGISQGHLYLMYNSDGATAATQPVFAAYFRLRFIDN